MDNRRKQIENTLTAIGIGSLLAGANYGLYCYCKEKSQQRYEAYPRPQARPKRGEMCPICLEALASNCRSFNCHHTFHKKCIAQWREISETCPVCRCSFENL